MMTSDMVSHMSHILIGGCSLFFRDMQRAFHHLLKGHALGIGLVKFQLDDTTKKRMLVLAKVFLVRATKFPIANAFGKQALWYRILRSGSGSGSGSGRIGRCGRSRVWLLIYHPLGLGAGAGAGAVVFL
jgi:hypothetical protein